ncbi:hypothetical protein SPFM12_00264 [Salmonella phage SPFM12]|nr:hypothetical protein SPFM12_00264 [Salmonella phage SPFM12]
MLLFATVAMCEFFTDLEYANMIWDVVEKSFLKRYPKMTPYNHKLFEGKLIKENLLVDVKALYYRLDDKKFAWWASERYLERFPMEYRISIPIIPAPASIEMSATLKPGSSKAFIAMDEVHEHFHLVYMAGIMLNPATNPVDLDTFYDVLGVGLVEVIILPTVSLQRFLKEYINTEAIYDALEMGKSGELDRRGISDDETGLRILRDEVLVCTGVRTRTALIHRPSYVPKWLFDVFAIQTGRGKTKSCMKSMVKRVYYQNEVVDAASDPNRPQTIYSCTFDNYGFSMVESDPESRSIEYAFQYKLTEHHPERGTPWTFIFHKVFAEKIKHILQRAEHGRITTERGDAYYAHIPSLTERAILAWAEENMHAPKMGKLEIQMTYTSMGVRVEVPIRQVSCKPRGLAPLFFCAKRGSMVIPSTKSRHRCTMT